MARKMDDQESDSLLAEGFEAKKKLRNRGPKRPDRASFGLRDGTTAQSADGCDSLSLSSHGVSTSGSDPSLGDGP